MLPPAKSTPARERRRAHAFDPRQRLQQEVEVLWLGRREAEPAIADDHRGDSVPTRRRARRFEHQLRVEVGVDVDEAGREHQTIGVDLLKCGIGAAADRRDAPGLAYFDIGRVPVTPRAIDDAVRRVSTRSAVMVLLVVRSASRSGSRSKTRG